MGGAETSFHTLYISYYVLFHAVSAGMGLKLKVLDMSQADHLKTHSSITENRNMNLQTFNVTHVYSCSLCIVYLPH